jgi:hypothetical protein
MMGNVTLGIIEAFIIAGITGAVSSVATVVAVKIDIAWLKGTFKRHEKRLDDHCQRINYVERKI